MLKDTHISEHTVVTSPDGQLQALRLKYDQGQDITLGKAPDELQLRDVTGLTLTRKADGGYQLLVEPRQMNTLLQRAGLAPDDYGDRHDYGPVYAFSKVNITPDGVAWPETHTPRGGTVRG